MRTALPANSTICFAINLRASSQTTIMQNTCQLTSATNSDFIPLGKDISITPKPGSYWVDLYVYVDPANGPCLSWQNSMAPANLAKVYPAGTYATIVNVADGATTSITMNDGYNGSNLAEAQSLPAVCTATASSAPSNFAITGGGQMTVSGAGLKIIGRAAASTTGAVMSGGGYKMIIR
jgi:hypothetical protein